MRASFLPSVRVRSNAQLRMYRALRQQAEMLERAAQVQLAAALRAQTIDVDFRRPDGAGLTVEVGG